MRDTQKFAGLLVLSYALLGSYGVDALVPQWRSRLGTSIDTPQLARLALVSLLVLSPLAYTAPMFAGFSGQLDTTTYPDSWHEANDQLGTEDTGRVLFLPWHQYLTFSWTERRIATPATLFFDRPVIEGRNLEVGDVESHASDPTHARVREALASPTDSAFGDRLASVGIEYVVLAHEADYRMYESLGSHPDFSVAFEGQGLTVFENDAFEEKSGAWPRAGPPIPGLGLVLGCLVSMAAVGILGGRTVRKRIR